MKDFFKYTLATVVGIIIVSIIAGVLTVGSIVGMLASEQSTQKVDDNSVFVLSLSGQLQERASDDPFSQISGAVSENIGLDDLLKSIKKAKDNDKIKGIYIEAGTIFSADSYASLQAVRKALADFRKSGKWIISYADTYTQATYYICSVADKVYINPYGQINWHGMASQQFFLKDLLAKFGIKYQLVKVGAYKSAPDMFIADKMSDANRKQVTDYVYGIWNVTCKDVAASRKVSVEALNGYADKFIMLADTKEYMKDKLVDGLLYTDQVKDVIKKRLALDKDDDINQLTLAQMINVTSDDSDDGDEIAVYYATGEVIDGEAQSLTTNGDVIDAQIVCRDLAKLADDDNVKAVVLRVNSGGGSAYASEQIWHSVMMLKAKKPVVVSMGGIAASGAYYISCPANWIVAEPTTLTGSIGIFGLIPDVSTLLTQKMGIKFDEVKTNKFSTFGTISRPLSKEETAVLQSYVDRGYVLFRGRVAQGRKLAVNDVEKIAGGHVWLGSAALGIKLVDQLGGLNEAVAKAASLAKTQSYYTCDYPDKPSFFDQLLNKTDKKSYLDESLHATLGDFYEPFIMLRNINNQNIIQARIPFYLNVN
jgi:protease-4